MQGEESTTRGWDKVSVLETWLWCITPALIIRLPGLDPGIIKKGLWLSSFKISKTFSLNSKKCTEHFFVLSGLRFWVNFWYFIIVTWQCCNKTKQLVSRELDTNHGVALDCVSQQQCSEDDASEVSDESVCEDETMFLQMLMILSTVLCQALQSHHGQTQQTEEWWWR